MGYHLNTWKVDEIFNFAVVTVPVNVWTVRVTSNKQIFWLVFFRVQLLIWIQILCNGFLTIQKWVNIFASAGVYSKDWFYHDKTG